jgi:RimJ/RimL family protein N-acetyltransferase
VTPPRVLSVRELPPEMVGLRIDYFHDATDEELVRMGVDRSLLPSREDWSRAYAQDVALPLPQRKGYALVWELDGEPVGFSTLDRLEVGHEARMHLHVTDPARRHAGLGTEFVRRSVDHYFGVLDLQRIFCEPNAFNQAPNRTLARVGFSYLFTHECTPGPINFFQATTRWVLERSDWRAPG